MKARPERAAAEALLIQGNSPVWVAEKLNLPLGSVKNWQRALKKSDLVPAAVDTVPEGKLMEIGDLLIQTLRAGIDATTSLKRLAQDEVWQRKQDARSVGTLLGILEDKNIRMLEAMERATGSKDSK